jgi:phosphoglycerol transferase MdoB-like AlkP superfamily enzyme
MTDNVTPLEALFERAEEYSKTSVDLFKLHAIDKSADVVSSLVSKLAVFIAVALFVLIISIGLALWTGELLGKSYYGFFLIGGFYAFVALMLHVFRHQWIKFPISNSIITQMRKIRIA